MKPKILVTRRLPPKAMALLGENFQVECNPHDRVLERAELLERVKGKEGLLPLLTDRIDGEVMDAAGKQLKIIANYAVGFNNIDVEAATHRKIAVSNTPGVLTETTADLTMEGDAFARSGQYEGWAPLLLLGTDVHHKTLGLLGFGRIGFAVAKRAAAFDMHIIYHDRVRAKPDLEKQVNARYVDKKALLKESDFLSIHVPLLPETRRLIGPEEISLMKSSAILINTSRGEIIDEAALAMALQEGKIRGAGLDVFEKEPEIHPTLTNMAAVVMLPHLGSASLETRTNMGLMAAENMIATFRGEIPPNCVNPKVFG
jgi:glyoxylate reductase